MQLDSDAEKKQQVGNTTHQIHTSEGKQKENFLRTKATV
jgi:hypothetical protein